MVGASVEQRIQRITAEHPKLDAYFDKIRKDNIHYPVGTVAWYLLVSILPLAIMITGGASLVIHNAHAQHVFVQQLSRAVQGILRPSYLEHLSELTIRHSVLSGIAVAVSALWAASNLGFALSRSLDSLFEVRPRPFLREKAIHMLMLIVYITVFCVIVGATVMRARLIEAVPLPPALAWLLSTALSLFAAFLLFAATYAVYPNTRVRLKLTTMWQGALLAAFLFQLLTYIWPLYEANLSRYGGILVPLIVLVMWIYFFSLILLMGAEVVAIRAIQEAKERGEQVGPTPDDTAPQHASLRKDERATG